jgi:bifunctional ADP-heptose synthase (sugar kinase/adenylyltransferase)
MLSDEVIVGVNSDEFVMEYRGNPALYTEQERADLIAALGYQIWINNGPGRETIFAVKPDILAIGSDWARKDYYNQIDISQDELDELDIMLLYVPYTAGISSTSLKDRLSAK